MAFLPCPNKNLFTKEVIHGLGYIDYAQNLYKDRQTWCNYEGANTCEPQGKS